MKNENVENRGIDEELFDMLCTALKEAPAANDIGLSLVYLGKGVAGVKVISKQEHTVFAGRLHGGLSLL